MNLGVWLFRNGIKQIDFAKSLGWAKGTLSGYVTGARTPHPEKMRAIFIATGGDVTPNDFYPIEAWRAELAETPTVSSAGIPPGSTGLDRIEGEASTGASPSSDLPNDLEAAE